MTSWTAMLGQQLICCPNIEALGEYTREKLSE
jgi:hypothetical protein